MPLAGVLALASGPRALGHLLLIARLGTLTLIGALASAASRLGLLSFPDFQPWWLLLTAVAAAFSWLQFAVRGRWAASVPVAESVAALLLVTAAGAEAWPLVIYLMMAPVFVGIATAGWLPVLVAGAQIVVLQILWRFEGPAWDGIPPNVMLRLAVVAMLFGVATSMVRRAADRTLKPPRSYVQALNLLEQLSDITRQLPSGLGIDAVSAETQQTLADSLGAAEVAIFVRRAGTWALHAGPDSAEPLADAQRFGEDLGEGLQPLTFDTGLAWGPWSESGLLRVLPLRVNGRLRAVAVARYTSRPASVPHEKVRRLAEDAAARLAAAEVYAEVRERATAEERRRVSREIHDGVAQDLAALTYRLDNIAADTGLEPVSQASEEVRRLVRELRLSIFDLRVGLERNEALGTAISEYAQQVATSTGIVVHTTVSEHGRPLDAHLQHEMLRVCQEAVANARRHSHARNMWITYRNYRGGWLLRVVDDGVGLNGSAGVRGLGGEGLAIMRERVSRMGGRLAVRKRLGGGTVIEVSLDRSNERTAMPEELAPAGQG